jgi:hypothetical protein
MAMCRGTLKGFEEEEVTAVAVELSLMVELLVLLCVAVACGRSSGVDVDSVMASAAVASGEVATHLSRPADPYGRDDGRRGEYEFRIEKAHANGT